MSKIVVGLYDRFEDAQAAVRELIDHGFRREDISLVASDSKGEFTKNLPRSGEVDDEVRDGAAGGAGIGAVLGGLGGLLVGLGALAIPGIGPVLAAGPLVSALIGTGVGAAAGAAAGGLIGALVDAGIPEEQAQVYTEGVRRGGTLLTVSASDDQAQQAVEIMNRYNPVDVQRRSSEWQMGQERTGYTTEGTTMREDMQTTYPRTGQHIDEGESATLPVIEEELRVGKREVETGGVRVHSRVTEQPVEEDINLRREHVEVERRPVDRPVSDADLDAFQEGTLEVTERSEEAVVDKQARVVEEVEVRKEVDERSETIRDTLRRTDVEVEDMGRGRQTDISGFDEYDRYFLDHYNTNFSNTNYAYDQYRPYYAYGYELANDQRYRGRNWDEIEFEARRDWERRNPDSMWEDFKDAVRAGWMRVTGQS